VETLALLKALIRRVFFHVLPTGCQYRFFRRQLNFLAFSTLLTRLLRILLYIYIIISISENQRIGESEIELYTFFLFSFQEKRKAERSKEKRKAQRKQEKIKGHKNRRNKK